MGERDALSFFVVSIVLLSTFAFLEGGALMKDEKSFAFSLGSLKETRRSEDCASTRERFVELRGFCSRWVGMCIALGGGEGGERGEER